MSSDSKPLYFAGCGEIGTLRCAGCLVAFYCGKVCQSNSWQQHKGPCKEVVKARAAVEEMEAKQKIEAAATATSSSSVTFCAKGCGEIATLRCPRFYSSGKIAWPDHKGPCKEVAEVISGRSIEQYDKDFESYKQGRQGG